MDLTNSIVLCILAMFEFARLNRKKDAGAREEAIEDKENEFAELGDKSPLFRCVASYEGFTSGTADSRPHVTLGTRSKASQGIRALQCRMIHLHKE